MSPAAALAWGMALLLEIEGIGPSWTRCVTSGLALQTQSVAVSPMAGGYVSIDQATFPDAVWMDAEVAITASKLTDLEVPPSKMKRAKGTVLALVRYWEQVLERPLPAGQGFAAGLEDGNE